MQIIISMVVHRCSTEGHQLDTGTVSRGFTETWKWYQNYKHPLKTIMV